MSVTININDAKITEKVNNPFSEQQMGMLCSQILRDCNKYCKEDQEGILIASSMIHSRLKEGLLVWQTPYAARQYYEIRTAYKDYNPMATWRWVEVAKQNYYQQWARQAQAIVRYYG